MSEALTSEIVGLIYSLLPGFIAGWIFHGLTAHPKKSPFERVVQALIFTGIVKAIVFPIRASWSVIGLLFFKAPPWSAEVEYFLSVLSALVVGFAFTSFANTNRFHSVLPEWITKRTSYPSEWYSIFYQRKRFVYLHLRDGRRIYGWPEQWPDAPSTGHFVLMQAKWFTDDNIAHPIPLTERILIPARNVSIIEQEKPSDEWTAFDVEQNARSEKTLIEKQQPRDAKNLALDSQMPTGQNLERPSGEPRTEDEKGKPNG